MGHLLTEQRSSWPRAYATLGHDPGATMLDAAALQMAERVAHFRPQARSRPGVRALRLGSLSVKVCSAGRFGS